ncbi:hypothetical protein T492DRAFT_1102175, partial [Pavlovales sp. CCMP2436]
PALKIGRERSSEVQFVGKRQALVLKGHYSPGPQYLLPSTIGTSGHSSPVEIVLAPASYVRGKAYDLSSIGRGALGDRAISETAAAETRDFWSQATSVKRASKLVPLSTWHAEARRDNPSTVSDITAEANRPGSHATHPKRNSLEPRADPPFATPFGRPSGVAKSQDFGQTATSIVVGYGATTTSFGTPPRNSLRSSSW